MAQNFVMAFGGTGARCLEAIAYLAAARSFREPVHVLLVDPDETNGNVAQALAQLTRYQSIQQRVQPNETGVGRAFFSTPVNEYLGPESFFWANPQQHSAFATQMEYSALGEDERALIDLLYDQSDLDLTFERGYIGRAHIGSLDLLRTLQTQVEAAANAPESERGRPDSMQTFFRSLRAATQQAGGARLLVIGSVFGGTGASGLPAVPPLLEETLLSGLQRELAIGCVQLAPYFTFPPGQSDAPDSALHPLATQAALYHYSLSDVGYDRIYLIGAPDREQANGENVIGGDAQRNSAHYVELASALAAVHFFATPPQRRNAEVVASGADEVVWDKLPARELANVRKNLVGFATFALMHGRFLGEALEQRRHQGTKWMTDLSARGGRVLGGQEPELRELREFCQRFLAWVAEIQRISDVRLYTLATNDSEEALGAVTSGGESKRPFHELMRELNRVGDVKQESGIGWYVQALTDATMTFCQSNYSAWWRKA